MKKDMLFGYVIEGVRKWQLDHIREGVEAASRGEFATDVEVESFLEDVVMHFQMGRLLTHMIPDS